MSFRPNTHMHAYDMGPWLKIKSEYVVRPQKPQAWPLDPAGFLPRGFLGLVFQSPPFPRFDFISASSYCYVNYI